MIRKFTLHPHAVLVLNHGGPIAMRVLAGSVVERIAVPSEMALNFMGEREYHTGTTVSYGQALYQSLTAGHRGATFEISSEETQVMPIRGEQREEREVLDSPYAEPWGV